MAKKGQARVLPMLPLRGLTVFPYMVLHFDVGREKSVAALEQAMLTEQTIFLSTQKDISIEEPDEQDIFNVGTISKIKQVLKLPGETIRVLVEGLERASISSYVQKEPYFQVELKAEVQAREIDALKEEALRRSITESFERYAKLSARVSPETLSSVLEVANIGQLADLIAANVLVKTEDKQEILESMDIEERIDALLQILNKETEILEIENKISQRVKKQLDKSQKEYYLREQIKAIQNELGDKDSVAESEELRSKIIATPLSEEARDKALKELTRLAKMAPGSPEITVSRTYIDWILELPWGVETPDTMDLGNAEKILEEDHYGLKKVKERVIEYLAVRQLKNNMKGPILCFVGPPGVGKTSIARSIARSLGRKFVRMSLGGVRDEAEIRGHRRTYIGSIPGRIISSIKQAGSMNPVFLFDEIDKMSSDFRGDPASAMLEVLDAEQNFAFRDHYLEVAFDLSKVMFLATANNADTIPRPLLDRMEVIEITSYTEEEKLHIAMRHLLPKQEAEHGLSKGSIQIPERTLREVVNSYTAESGVRNLERELANICRKAARETVQSGKKTIRISQANIEKYLGKKKYRHDKADEGEEVGMATGLAWTSVGGETLNIEVTCMHGNGKLELTGQLGDVMKESAKAGLSYIRSKAEALGIDPAFGDKTDIHIHIPEGAIPKDGPSAGITMATALISALSGRAVRKDVAMTGEITLRGKVLPIGGLKEKILAAHRAGIKRVILPVENEKDLDDIPVNVKKKLEFIPAKEMDQVLQAALVQK